MANILLVDDHQIVIDGLRTLLEEAPIADQLFEALTGKAVLEKVAEESIDLILLDVNLPDRSGFDICAEIKEKYDTIKIIALTMYGNAGYINKMIKAGADGYLLKNTGKEELLQAVQTVMDGERYFSKQVTDILVSGLQEVKKPKTGSTS